MSLAGGCFCQKMPKNQHRKKLLSYLGPFGTHNNDKVPAKLFVTVNKYSDEHLSNTMKEEDFKISIRDVRVAVEVDISETKRVNSSGRDDTRE